MGTTSLKRKVCIGLFFLSTPLLQAHPVSYTGALSVMTWSQPWLSDFWTTYTFRHDMAIAGRFMRMEMPEGKGEIILPQYDLLLKRWNQQNYQANVYLYGGIGQFKQDQKRGAAFLNGFEADAESRNLFIMIKAERLNSSLRSHMDFQVARIGIAPYESEFQEMASWFMIQYQSHPDLVKTEAITPLARFFYRNVLWETGMSLDGDLMLNLMFHF